MRALAAEMTKALGSRLEALGLQVCAVFVAERSEKQLVCPITT